MPFIAQKMSSKYLFNALDKKHQLMGKEKKGHHPLDRVVDATLIPDHTPTRASTLGPLRTEERSEDVHSFVVKNGEVYKQTTKG